MGTATMVFSVFPEEYACFMFHFKDNVSEQTASSSEPKSAVSSGPADNFCNWLETKSVKGGVKEAARPANTVKVKYGFII